MDINLIRNFAIIAHIDHGKSTIADRLIEFTDSIDKRKMRDQFLDSLDIERERGITIKAQTVRLMYKYKDGFNYQLNLVDTPGHVDFTYEVSRSLKACEGAILVVDASQGVQAQTIANACMAADQNLEIIPVINKIDLPNANTDKTKKEIEEIVGIDASKTILTSAKLNIGTHELLDSIVEYIPHPTGNLQSPLKALIIDSWYDSYRGVIILVRVFDGKVSPEDNILFMATDKMHTVETVGIFNPLPQDVSELGAGEIGYIIAGVKHIKNIKIGDTITHIKKKTTSPLPGFKTVKPVVYCGFYPVDPNDFDNLKDALEKLSLNDASFTFEPEQSNSLGVGYRLGFLGVLHMEIIQERLEREFELYLVTTAPTVRYKVYNKDNTVVEIDNPSNLPEASFISKIEEPYIFATIMIPSIFTGSVLQMLQNRRGIQKDFKYISGGRVIIEYYLPLAEMVLDFYDKLMSTSRGYASFDYEHAGYREADLVKLEIIINRDVVDALSVIAHREQAYYKGRDLVEKIKEVMPRQQFELAIQASLGKKVIARATVKAYRKNVIAKCYGGDITRKKKLLEKQKEGKKRMKQIGKLDIPQEVFLSILKI